MKKFRFLSVSHSDVAATIFGKKKDWMFTIIDTRHLGIVIFPIWSWSMMNDSYMRAIHLGFLSIFLIH
jgi:hypothetical protein